MKTVNRISIDNYYELRKQLREDQKKVLDFFETNRHKSFTTRNVAQLTSIDILTVRPRVTELKDRGFLRETGKIRKEGLYQYQQPVIKEEQLSLL